MKKLALALAALMVSVFVAQAQLPSVQLQDINGKTVNAATLSNDGKPLAILYIYNLCSPCWRAMKAINEEYAKWQKETGVKLIVINVYTSEEDGDFPTYKQKAINSLERRNCKYDLLFDCNNVKERLCDKLGISQVPYIIIMDGYDEIVYAKNIRIGTDNKEEVKRELYNKIRSIPSIEPVNSKIRTRRN